MKKAHRANTDDPRDFVLVKEVAHGDSHSAGSAKRSSREKGDCRILADDENVYQAQIEWKTAGRFVLMSRQEVLIEDEVCVHFQTVFSILRNLNMLLQKTQIFSYYF